MQKKCPFYKDVCFIEIFSKIVWPQSKAILPHHDVRLIQVSALYCVRFIEIPLYRPLQMVLARFRWFQLVLDGFRSFQLVPQVVLGRFRWCQHVLNGFRQYQIVLGRLTSFFTLVSTVLNYLGILLNYTDFCVFSFGNLVFSFFIFWGKFPTSISTFATPISNFCAFSLKNDFHLLTVFNNDRVQLFHDHHFSFYFLMNIETIRLHQSITLNLYCYI